MEKNSLSDYSPKHSWLVCIDSDGCAFDTMELKHKECFCPVTIRLWDLQPISKFARDAWDYGNLYSKHRGRSRFHEMVLLYDLLKDRKDVQAYNYEFPDISSLREWVDTSSLLSNADLKNYPDDPILAKTLEWSLECNRNIAEMVHGVPPFPGVRESLVSLAGKADIAIVSATAQQALQQEWTEHDLMPFVHQLCAQEDGSKKHCIRELSKHYAPDHVLMLGDAPGDMEAAKANNALFFPIIPGREIASWQEFLQSGIPSFLDGSYRGEYENRRIHEFDQSLPDSPPWETIS